MLRSLAALALAGSLSTAVDVSPPGDVLVDDIDGLTVLVEELDLDVEQYEVWAPDHVDHLDPTSEAATEMRGAYRVWGGDGIDGVIVNLTVWPTIDDAARYVDQAAREAAALGLGAADAPFDGVLRFEGDDPEGTHTTYLAWRHGRYGIAMVSVGGPLGELLVSVAAEQETLLDTAGGSVGTTDETGSVADAVVTLLIVAAIVAAGVWLYVRVRRKARDRRAEHLADERRDRSADEIIDQARAMGRARDEVERESAKWQVPDDV